jgi:hypothetical protein
MSAVRVGQVWRCDGPGNEWEIVSLNPVVGRWVKLGFLFAGKSNCLGTVSTFAHDPPCPGWTLISDATAAAETHVGPCYKCGASHNEACRPTCKRTTARVTFADPPVAERVQPKPTCSNCHAPGLFPERAVDGGDVWRWCDPCYLEHENDIAIRMKGTIGDRLADESLPTGAWRAPDLLARPWLYRGRGR